MGARGCGVMAAPTNPVRSWAGFDRSIKIGGAPTFLGGGHRAEDVVGGSQEDVAVSEETGAWRDRERSAGPLPTGPRRAINCASLLSGKPGHGPGFQITRPLRRAFSYSCFAMTLSRACSPLWGVIRPRSLSASARSRRLNFSTAPMGSVLSPARK